jgi:hypothetical protein
MNHTNMHPFFNYKVHLTGEDAELFQGHIFLKPIKRKIEHIFDLDPERVEAAEPYPRSVNPPTDHLGNFGVERVVTAIVSFKDGGDRETIIAEVWVTKSYSCKYVTVCDERIHVSKIAIEMWSQRPPHELAEDIVKMALKKIKGKRQLAGCMV